MKKNNIDWTITILPLCIITALAILLIAFPESAGNTISLLRNIFVNKMGFFYILIGLFTVGLSIYLAFSKYGNIKLGTIEKPRYSNFAWGSMIFTSTMAADILYWSLIEWAYYFSAKPFAMETMTLAQKQDWASTFPLFHWGITPWSFYILPAVAFGYMLYIRGCKKQKLSEACRPILGKHIDGFAGKAIDLFSVCGLLAGTATTFSMATPLLALAISSITNIPPSNGLTIIILICIAIVYTLAVLFGFKGISYLAKISVICFALLLSIFVLFGNPIYTIETGISAIGNMLQNFLKMSTWMDPLRLSGDGVSGFPQDWTIFYWAYWIAWFVATPFFIGQISEGRKIKNVICGGYLWGIAGTFLSFIILGNYGLFQQVNGIVPASEMLASGKSASEVILAIFNTLPITKFALIVLVVTMIAFYSSTFDAITMVVSAYSQKELNAGTEPQKGIRAYWAILFILLPAALIFSESTLSMLQTLSIIVAFPLGIIMLIIIFSFFKELRNRKDI